MQRQPGFSKPRCANGQASSNDAAWQQNFSAMIEKARPHGWIDDQRNAIKAHIEWVYFKGPVIASFSPKKI